MQRFVVLQNIERFQALLNKERDPHQRQVITDLLTVEREKLATLGNITQGEPKGTRGSPSGEGRTEDASSVDRPDLES